MIPAGSDATKAVQLLAALAAVAVVVAGLTGSVAAALSSLLVALVTWRLGVRAAAVAALLALMAVATGSLTASLVGWLTLAAHALLFAAAAGAAHSLHLAHAALDALAPSTAGHPATGPRVTPSVRDAIGSTPTPRSLPRLQLRRDEQSERESRAELDVIHRFLRDAREALGADDMMFWRHNAPDGELHPHSWGSDPEVKPAFLEDSHTGPLIRRAAETRTVSASGEGDRALFMVAPVGKGEQLHGVLAVHAADARALPRESARRWLGRYASHLSLLLDLLEEGRTARRYRARAQRFDQAASAVQSTLDPAELVRSICESAIYLASASRSALLLWEPQSDSGAIRGTSPAHPIPEGFRVAGDSLVANAARDGQRFVVRDAHRMASGRPIYCAGEPRRAIASLGITPLKRANRVLGAIIVEGDAASQVTAVEVELLWQLSSIIVGALEATHEITKLGESASTDPLTGLPNRRFFDQRLAQHLAESDRYGHPTSLVLMDVDHFKRVNDTHGHQGGDAVLRQVATAVNAGVRTPIDVCARFGGEELAIILPNTPLSGACETAERLRKAVEHTYIILAGGKLRVTASFGVATYPESTRSAEQLFAAADRALYEAKAAGRNCVRSYTVIV